MFSSGLNDFKTTIVDQARDAIHGVLSHQRNRLVNKYREYFGKDNLKAER